MARFRWPGGVVVAAVSSISPLFSGVALGDIGTDTGNWIYYGNWSYRYTATFGQTFVGNGEACSGFRFRFYNESCCSY